MVRAAYQMALVSEHVKAEAIEVSEFPDLARRYEVKTVPLTLIGERIAVLGAVPEKGLVEQVVKATQSAAAQPSEVRGPTSVVQLEGEQGPQGPRQGEGRPGSGLILP